MAIEYKSLVRNRELNTFVMFAKSFLGILLILFCQTIINLFKVWMYGYCFERVYILDVILIVINL